MRLRKRGAEAARVTQFETLLAPGSLVCEMTDHFENEMKSPAYASWRCSSCSFASTEASPLEKLRVYYPLRKSSLLDYRAYDSHFFLKLCLRNEPLF